MNKKISKPKIVKTAVWLLLAIVLGYIVFQILMVSTPNVRTETAIKYDLSDVVSCNAIMAMPQEEILYDGGIADYVISSGDKVAAGATIARIFSTTEQAFYFKKAQQISEEIALLKNSQKNTAGVNIAALLSQSSTSLYNIIDSVQNNNFNKIHEQKSLLQSALNKTNIATGKATSYDSRIELLSQTSEALIASSGENISIKSPKIGYFISAKYCSKQLFEPSQLKEMSPQEIKTAAESDVIMVEDNVLGHLIYDYRWTCYLSTNVKQAQKFIEGQNVFITFTELSKVEIPATITAVKFDESTDTAKITLSSSYMSRDIAAVQTAKVDITLLNKGNSAFTGIRIPKEALRVVDGNYGVYIKHGNLTQYRKIEVLFENENYILCPLKYESGKNEIRLYDEVIVEGRGLLPIVQAQSNT